MKFTNRIITTILCILMISAIACLSVSAKTVYPVGNWVYEKINNNTEFEIDEYKGSAATVSTPFYHNNIPITSVGSGAFTGNETITKITLNTNIYAIQDHAFLNCVNLESVVIIGNVSSIAYSAFAGCSSLSSINLENTSIDNVSASCFMNCDALTTVTLPETVTAINSQAFAYCDGLEKITIPQSVTTIADDAFKNTPNVVIYCYENSAAHKYAVDNEIDYVLITEIVETYILGDTDDDKVVSVVDATLVQMLTADKETDEDGRKTIRGDADEDDVLSIVDATYIQRYVASISDNTNVGKTFEY